MVVNFLRDAGFDNAVNLNGGIEAWARGIDRSRRELSLLKALRSAPGQRRNRSVRFIAPRAGRLAAKVANAVRLWLFLANSVGVARGA